MLSSSKSSKTDQKKIYLTPKTYKKLLNQIQNQHDQLNKIQILVKKLHIEIKNLKPC